MKTTWTIFVSVLMLFAHNSFAQFGGAGGIHKKEYTHLESVKVSSRPEQIISIKIVNKDTTSSTIGLNQGQVKVYLDDKEIYTYKNDVHFTDTPMSVSYYPEKNHPIEIIFHVKEEDRYCVYGNTGTHKRVRLYMKKDVVWGITKYVLDDTMTKVEDMKIKYQGPLPTEFISRSYIDLNDDGRADEVLVINENDPETYMTSQKNPEEGRITVKVIYAKLTDSAPLEEKVIEVFDNYFFENTPSFIQENDDKITVNFTIRIRTEKALGQYTSDKFNSYPQSVELHG